MSTAPLPPLAPGAIPPAVRAAGPDAVEGFRAALGFERMLLTQMLSEALPGPGGGEGEEGGGDPRLADLPGTVADAIVSQGGAGLADDLYSSFAPRAQGEDPR